MAQRKNITFSLFYRQGTTSIGTKDLTIQQPPIVVGMASPSSIQEKVEKKPSTAARMARGLGLKRHEKENTVSASGSKTSQANNTPIQNGQMDKPSNISQAPILVTGRSSSTGSKQTSIQQQQPPAASTLQQQQPQIANVVPAGTPTASLLQSPSNAPQNLTPQSGQQQPQHIPAYRLDR
jgi:hypothetical protein